MASPSEPVPPAEGIEIIEAHPAPDLILYDADIVTMDSAQPVASAIAGDTILAMAAADQTSVVDLHGLTTMPGFIDSHAHRITQRANWCPDSIEEASQEALPMGWTGLDELYVDQNQLGEMIAAN